jgi:Domain of unknown function (DUF4270)
MIQFCRRINPTAAQLAAFFLLSVFFLSSCKKYDDELGYNLLTNTGQALGTVVDSFNIVAYTVNEDSIKSDSLSLGLLGAVNDPDFGVTSSNLYMQCLLEEINIDFGTNPLLDSIVLTIDMDKEDAPYGNVNSNTKVNVFKMDELLLSGDQYYSNYQPALGNQIGTWTGRLNPKDTSWFYEDGNLQSQEGLLRLRLNDDFGQEFFSADAFGSNESFLSFLNGIAILPDESSLSSGEGSVAPVNLNSTDSKLTLYFNDSLKKEFVISDQSERMMNYEVSSQSVDITTQLATTGIHYDQTYLQAMSTVKTRVEIPGLFDIVKNEGRVLVNEAKLTLTIKDGTISDDFPAPSRLLLVQPSKDDGTGGNTFIIDLVDAASPPSSWVGFTNYGGNLNEDGKTYTFRFNRHLQYIYDRFMDADEEINRGFYIIVPSDNPITPSRLILDTRNDQNIQNIKLKITYTKL